jgi:hypothetical protein
MGLLTTNAPSLRPCPRAEPRQIGPIHASSGNLRKPRTAWWAREDSNPQPDRYERPALTIELHARIAVKAVDSAGAAHRPAIIERTYGDVRF